jgi:hypothetical protein
MRNTVCNCVYMYMVMNIIIIKLIIRHTDNTASHEPVVSGSTAEAHIPRQEEEAPGWARSSACDDNSSSTQCWRQSTGEGNLLYQPTTRSQVEDFAEPKTPCRRRLFEFDSDIGRHDTYLRRRVFHRGQFQPLHNFPRLGSIHTTEYMWSFHRRKQSSCPH